MKIKGYKNTAHYIMREEWIRPNYNFKNWRMADRVAIMVTGLPYPAYLEIMERREKELKLYYS